MSSRVLTCPLKSWTPLTGKPPLIVTSSTPHPWVLSLKVGGNSYYHSPFPNKNMAHSVTHSVTHSLSYSPTLTLTLSITHSLAQLLTHSHSHSFTNSLTHSQITWSTIYLAAFQNKYFSEHLLSKNTSSVCCFNPLMSSVTFLYPWKQLKTYVFLMFSGGIKMWHWTLMG